MSQPNPNPQDPRLTVAEARDHLLSTLTPVAGWECVAIRDALGRVLSRPVIAPFDVPAHDNSAMDGYAVRFDDLASGAETELRMVGTAYAGRAFSGIVGAGQAVRVMTGAVVPKGSDTIVVQEVTRVDGERVFVPPGQRQGQNLRRAGEDLARGKPALAAGKRIGAADLGLLASLGVAEVTVFRRLRVAFMSTGDEIASIGNPLGPGQVYDSNRYTLHAALSALGVDLVDMGVIRDQPALIEEAFRTAAASADVVITSGGVSVGEADFVRDLMARLGEVHFWKLDIKPGRPMAFGRVGEAWLFGLPGNPVAVMVSYAQFVVDSLQKLMGVDPLPARPTFEVACDDAIRKNPGRREFPRGELYPTDGGWRVRLAGNQGSGVLRSMAEANCFIVLDEARGNVAAGDPVHVQLFDGLF
ncbi:MAG: molybdopterin molybdotransferase MoeA [Rhodocyclaceae bacterium]|nr:molybdopterin molybdotransferase MoeA [Rhodocyclaceae bacterium]